MDEYIILMIKVFKLRELIKYFIIVVICIVALQLVKIPIRWVKNENCIKRELPCIEQEKKNKDWKMAMIERELPKLNLELNQELNQVKEEVVEEKQEEVVHPKDNVNVEVIKNSVNPRSTNEYKGVQINNSTDYQLSEELLNPDGLQVNKNKILIYHTHTCESYTKTELNNYTESGSFRSLDLNYSVAKVGDELEKQFTSYGHNVIHDKTYHDYPAYNGSYSRSLKTAEKIIKENKDIEISIDLHRDAIADSSYAPKVKIGDEYVSQLMFVIGSDKVNKNHKDWDKNLKFAIKVQQKANELYPGLFKPIILRNSEYNQHISKAACIIEVGATGNTLEESVSAMKYLAKIIEAI